MIGWWGPESMLQNSKSSFRCDLTKTTDGANLECSSYKRRFKKGENDLSNFFHKPRQTKLLLYPLYPWEGMLWKSPQEDHFAQDATFPRTTSTKSWNMAYKRPQITRLCKGWPKKLLLHQFTSRAYFAGNHFRLQEKHILRSGDSLYLKSAFSKHIEWKYPPI